MRVILFGTHIIRKNDESGFINAKDLYDASENNALDFKNFMSNVNSTAAISMIEVKSGLMPGGAIIHKENEIWIHPSLARILSNQISPDLAATVEALIVSGANSVEIPNNTFDPINYEDSSSSDQPPNCSCHSFLTPLFRMFG